MFGEVAKRVRVEIEVSFADDEIRRLQVAEFAQFGIGEGGLPRPAPPQQIDAADVARAEGLQRVIGNVCLFQLLRRPAQNPSRSEEHTSELQSRGHLVCRLLLEKKKKTQ